jgi:hypothetical protein
MSEFMNIQEQLMLEQLELLQKCELGKKLLRGVKPRSVHEFRRLVPITTYPDYAPYLPDKKEEALPMKPLLWQRTSGRSAEYSYKWVPVTPGLYRELGDMFMALLLFASCQERGEMFLQEHDRFLYGLAPPPYASGCWARRVDDEKIFDFLPPVDQAEGMTFQKRIEEGFKMGMSQGIDIMAGISVMLIAVGERFGQGGGLKRALPLLAKPRLLARLTMASLRARAQGRHMLPRDIWRLKALVSTGTDAQVYRERIKEMWGRYPLDIYGCTETNIIAMQTWDYGDMTFVPNLNLLEFMPEDEYTKWSADQAYQPRTVLLNEVIPGQRYVMVLTNFLGGPFVRYMNGDMIEITAIRNAKLNINIPQMSFYSRADGAIDFTYASFTEKTIWQAIENAGLAYVDWVARKETEDNPRLHVYLELKDHSRSAPEVTAAIDGQLRILKEDYRHMKEDQNFDLLKVTLLPEGAFKRYIAKRQAAGADVAHLKPPHINPVEDALETLLEAEVTAASPS